MLGYVVCATMNTFLDKLDVILSDPKICVLKTNIIEFEQTLSRDQKSHVIRATAQYKTETTKT